MSSASGRVDVAAAAPCPGCAAPVAAGDRFCEVCGTDLGPSRGTPTPLPATTAGCPHCGHRATAEDPADGYCPSCGLRLPDGTDHVEVAVTGAAAVSDRGRAPATRTRWRSAGARDRSARTAGPSPPSSATGCHRCRARSARRGPRPTPRSSTCCAPRPGAAERAHRAAVAAGAAAAAGLAPAGPHAPSCTLVCGLVDLTDPAAPVLTVGWAGQQPGLLARRRDYRARPAAHRGPRRRHRPAGHARPGRRRGPPDAITRWWAPEPGQPQGRHPDPGRVRGAACCAPTASGLFPAPTPCPPALPALYDGARRPPPPRSRRRRSPPAARTTHRGRRPGVPVPVPGAVDRATDPATVPSSRSSP